MSVHILYQIKGWTERRTDSNSKRWKESDRVCNKQKYSQRSSIKHFEHRAQLIMTLQYKATCKTSQQLFVKAEESNLGEINFQEMLTYSMKYRYIYYGYSRFNTYSHPHFEYVLYPSEISELVHYQHPDRLSLSLWRSKMKDTKQETLRSSCSKRLVWAWIYEAFLKLRQPKRSFSYKIAITESI